MASACNLFTCVPAHPNSFGSTACTSHRHPATVLSAPISSPFEQIERRLSTCRLGGPVETKAQKPIKLQYGRREVSCNAEVTSGHGTQGAEHGGVEEEGAVPDFDISRLEAYTDRYRREVLGVNALLEDEEEDQVIVFKGFSSSLIRATPDDPSEPILPPTAVIQSIDRMQAPLNRST